MNNEYDFAFKDENEMQYAFKTIANHCKEKKWKNDVTEFSEGNLAILIDTLRNLSSRYIAELAYPINDTRFGIQLCGRDVKRWAAEIVGNLEEARSDWAN